MNPDIIRTFLTANRFGHEVRLNSIIRLLEDMSSGWTFFTGHNQDIFMIRDRHPR